MNAIAESVFVAAPFQTAGDIIIDCKVDKIFYGDFLAVRDSTVPIENKKRRSDKRRIRRDCPQCPQGRPTRLRR